MCGQIKSILCCGMCDKDLETEIGDGEFVDRRNRRCTDILMLLVFIICTAATVVIIITAKGAGANPKRIVYGMDYQGRICGEDAGVEDKKRAAWVDFQTSTAIKICVASCDETNSNVNGEIQRNYTALDFLGLYCLPTTSGGINVQLSGDFDSVARQAQRAVGSLFIVWPVLLAAAPVALILSFMYTLYLKHCAKCMVWSMLAVLIIGGGAGGYVLFKKGKDSKDFDYGNLTNASTWMFAFGALLLASAVILLLMVIFMFKRIGLAIAVVRMAAQAVNDMKCMVCFPIIPLIMGVAYVCYWVVVCLYIASVQDAVTKSTPGSMDGQGSPALPSTYTDYEWNSDWFYTAWYALFILLWTIQFFLYFTYMVLAGAVAEWYFSDWTDANYKSKKRGNEIGELSNWPIYDSCVRTSCKHLGSIAFGALFIAILQTAQAVVHYIEKQTKGSDNQCKKAIFCLIKCCLWCAECCCDKLNKSAFCWMSVKGDPLCKSACSAFAFLWSNILRVAAISVIGAYLLFVGKLSIAIGTAGLGLLAIQLIYDDEVANYVLPGFVIFVIGFLVATLFMTIFETAIDCIFFCFLMDEKANGGTPLKAGAGLKHLVEENKDRSQEEGMSTLKTRDPERYAQIEMTGGDGKQQ